MELDEARKLARALILEGVDDPGGKSERLEEIQRFIDELDGQVRRRKDRARHHRTHVKLMRRDLKVDKDSLRRLVSAAWLLWRVAMDDYEMRHKPYKPKDEPGGWSGQYKPKDDHEGRGAPYKPRQKLEDNWDPDPNVVAHDYGDQAGLGLENWDEWWEEVYRAPPGRRWPETVPRVPLYEVFFLARAWWFKNTGKRTFGLSYKGKRREDFTAAERFFLDIAQAMDPGYTARDCATVYESCRK